MVSEKDIKTAIKKKDFSKAMNNIILAVKEDMKNVVYIENLADEFIENGLSNDLIEMYKLMFYYTVNTIYFEKIVDVLYKNEEYSEAVENYLNCAEGIGGYSQIYKKLANVFEKLNDNESKLACLKQVEIIEGAK